MSSIRERWEAVKRSDTYKRDQIRAQIKALEDYRPRNAEDFDFREAEIRRLRGLLL
jgi:hypothetical protein